MGQLGPVGSLVVPMARLKWGQPPGREVKDWLKTSSLKKGKDRTRDAMRIEEQSVHNQSIRTQDERMWKSRYWKEDRAQDIYRQKSLVRVTVELT